MKKIILLIVLLLSLFGNSQTNKFKFNTIYSKGMGVNYVEITVRENLDENNIITSKTFVLKMQDVRYTRITNLVECFVGTGEELLKFIDDLQSFYLKNEVGIYMEFGNYYLRVAKYGIGITFKDKLNEVGIYKNDFIKLKYNIQEYLKK